MRTLCKDLAATIPSLKKVNRGKMSFYDIEERAFEIGADRVLIIDRWKGRPGRIRLFEIKNGIQQTPPQIYVRGVKFRRDFKIKPADHSSPQSIFIEEPEGLDEDIKRLSETFARFFEVPKLKPEMTEEPQSFKVMRFSVEPENIIRVSFYLMPKNIEVGPRIRISHMVWEI
ncbi:MAG TPA: hypothetical protein ENG18_02150 [Nitrososphaeria archaeon]|nr:hypothetical protein [Nitrososphaeria archaeon]